MKIVAKTKAILICTKAESMAEVIVAFLVLTIIMVLFANGMQFAARAESYATDNTKSYDKAMRELQRALAGETEDVGATKEKTEPVGLNGYEGQLSLSLYSADLEGDEAVCYYYVFDVPHN